MRSVECRDCFDPLQVAHILDISKPAAVFRRIGGYGEQGNEDIQHRRDQHGGDQDAAYFSDRECVFLGEMRDVLKSDEGPWRNGRDADDLGEGIGFSDI